MPFGIILAGPGDDLQARVQSTRGEHNVEVGRVGGGGGNQSPGTIDLCRAQSLFLGRISVQQQPVLRAKALPLGLRILDDHEWHRLARQYPGDASANPAQAANDEVAVESCDLALHATASKETLQLEF